MAKGSHNRWSQALAEQYRIGLELKKRREEGLCKLCEYIWIPLAHIPPAQQNRVRREVIADYAEEHNMTKRKVHQALTLADAVSRIELKSKPGSASILLDPKANLTIAKVIELSKHSPQTVRAHIKELKHVIATANRHQYNHRK